MIADSASGRMYYGWYIAFGVGITACIAWGTGFYQLGVFARAFHQAHGWSLAELSFGMTIFYIIVGVGSLATGRLVDRFGPRRVLLGGGVALALGAFLFGEASSLWQVFVADAVLAAGFASTSTLVLGAVIGRWFRRRRALVMTLALTGAPLGALILVPISTMLIERYGITDASRALALIALLGIVPIALFMIRDTPAERDLVIERDSGPSGSADPAEEPLWPARAAAMTPVWRLLTLSYAAIMVCQVTFLLHQVSFLTPQVGAGSAAGIVSITGAAGIAGRFAGGLGDKLRKDRLLAGYCLLQATGVTLSAVASSNALLIAGSAIVGFTMGNTLALQPVLMADRFGMRSYGAVFGPTLLLTQLCAAIGLTAVGFLAQATGSYTVPYLITGSLAFVAGIAAFASGTFSVEPAPAAPVTA